MNTFIFIRHRFSVYNLTYYSLCRHVTVWSHLVYFGRTGSKNLHVKG